MTARLESPALHGLLQPTLLLPHGLVESFKVEQLRFVFLHELAHVRRFDVLVNWIAAVAAALHWFNPLVRIAVSRLAEERELACDALALEHLASAERSAYGGTLLRILEQWRLAPAVPGLVGMTSANQHVKRRIQMIATFRSESRRALWIALVATLSIVSLTDATAGDHRRVVHFERLSPEAEAVMRQLDAHVSVVLTSVPLSELTNVVSNASGVTITAAEDAMDASVRDARFTLKAENVPAHIVLMESLSAVGLGVQFSATGAQIVKQETGVPGAVPFIRPAPHAANGKDRVVFFEKHVAKSGDGAIEPAPAIAPPDGDVKLRRHIDVQVDKASDGVTRRKVTFRGSEGGQVDGTFELEVTPAAASSAN